MITSSRSEGGGRSNRGRPRDFGSAPPREITQQWTQEERGTEAQATDLATTTYTATEATTYSGMGAAIRKGGLGTKATITQDLACQRSGGGNTTRINQWKDVMGSLQDFKAYLFVKQGSCFATVMHSPLKFAAISAATQHLLGRIIGFVGDRTTTREPTPILLPQLKTWQWVKESVFTDGPALIKHYEDDASRIGTLWKGEGADATSKGEIQVPRLIAIPLWLLDRIRKEGRALMPQEILRIVVAHLEEANDAQYAMAWETLATWCYMASQGNKDGEILTSFSIEAITEVEDEYLGKWLEQRLDTAMGPRPRGGAQGVAQSVWGQTWAMSQATLAADIGKGVTLGLKAMGGQMPSGQQQATTKEGDEKTRYTDDDIAVIMGFSHASRGDEVQPIWITLNNTKQKNIDVFRRQIYARMLKWAYDR